jgi:hypothetical protein
MKLTISLHGREIWAKTWDKKKKKRQLCEDPESSILDIRNRMWEGLRVGSRLVGEGVSEKHKTRVAWSSGQGRNPAGGGWINSGGCQVFRVLFWLQWKNTKIFF